MPTPANTGATTPARINPKEKINSQTLKPFITEGMMAAAFLAIWIFPVAAALLVSQQGLQFSYIGIRHQNQNNSEIANLLFISTISFFASTLIFIPIFSKASNLIRLSSRRIEFTDWLPITIIAISAVGAYISLGGSIFEKSYSGPSQPWLGYGAWGATLLLATTGLLAKRLAFRPITATDTLLVVAIFLPLLFSGSRIDFLSILLAVMAHISFTDTSPAKRKLLHLFIALTICFTTIIAIANIRYINHEEATPKIPAISAWSLPVTVSNKRIYLSTAGDVGASVFQMVGLLSEGAMAEVGLLAYLKNQIIRLLPGPIFSNRPPDIWSDSPENIGGGALHAVGEGYLVAKKLGVVIVCTLFGAVMAVSILARRKLITSPTPAAWILFALPWLLMFRAGWYQLFSLFKIIEILIFFWLLVQILERRPWLQAKST